MEISDVRVRLVRDANERLKAVCSITLDNEFVVRDVKIVEGASGLFVAMPSRKLSTACPKCRAQNYVRAKYCGECGAKLPPARIPSDSQGREKAHRDVAHPITASFRQAMQERVLDAYRCECEETEDAGYPAEVTDDYDNGEEEITEYDALISELKGGEARRREPRHPEGRPEPDRRRDSGDRSRRRRPGGRRRDQAESGRRVEEETARDRNRPATSTAPPEAEPDEPFGADLEPEPTPEPQRQERGRQQPPRREPAPEGRRQTQPEPTEAPAQPSEGPPEQDTDDEFGAGIL